MIGSEGFQFIRGLIDAIVGRWWSLVEEGVSCCLSGVIVGVMFIVAHHFMVGKARGWTGSSQGISAMTV